MYGQAVALIAILVFFALVWITIVSKARSQDFKRAYVLISAALVLISLAYMVPPQEMLVKVAEVRYGANTTYVYTYTTVMNLTTTTAATTVTTVTTIPVTIVSPIYRVNPAARYYVAVPIAVAMALLALALYFIAAYVLGEIRKGWRR